MPHVDSTLLLPLGTSLLFLLWLSFCGAVLVRFCCSIRSWTLLPPLGLAAGCAIFLVCANLLGKVGALPEGSGIAVLIGRVGTARLAFGGAFLLLSVLGIYASFQLRPRSWLLPSRQLLLAVCGYSLLALVLAYVCLAIRNQSYFYDFPTHLAFATTIARDNLPVHNPYAPVLPSGYHYGAALLAASLIKGPDLSPLIGYQLLAAMQGAALLLLVFALGRDAGKHVLWGLVCLIAALAMGSLVVWWPFAGISPQLADLVRGNFSQESILEFPSLGKHIDLAYPFRSFSTDLRWLLVYPHRVAGFLTVVALAVTVVGPGKRNLGLGAIALSISLAAATALYDETMLPLALMALAWPLLLNYREPRKLLPLLGGLAAAILLIALQGGSVTDTLLGSTGSRANLGLRSLGGVVSSLVFVSGLPNGWLWILPPIPLAAGAAVFLWKRWWLGLMLSGFGFAGFVGFHMLSFGEVAGEGELARIVNLSFLALALVAPLTVARLLRDAPWRRTALTSLLLLPIALPTLLQPVASVVLDLPHRISLHDPALPGLVYTPQITDPWVTRRLDEYRYAYRDVAYLMSDDSVMLTQFPVSFVIATGIPAAFAPTEGVTLFPTHIYIPGPAFYDAFWRLDPAAWRQLGATAVLYHQRTYDSLPASARVLLEDDGWFVRGYDGYQLLLFTPTQTFLNYGPTPPRTLSALDALLPPEDTLFLATGLPFGIGQALVRQLKDHPSTGLGPDTRAHLWITVNRPVSLTEAEATWHVRKDSEVRLSGTLPEAALWHWRAPNESVGVYPNDTIPAFSLRLLAAGQSVRLHASRQDLVLEDGPTVTSPVQFRSLSLVLAGNPGSVVQVCSPAGCAQRDLSGVTWVIGLPLNADLSQFTLSAVQGEAFIAGTLGFSEPLTAFRAPGVVLRSRQTGNTIEVDVSYFNRQGWTHGDGVAWHLVRVADGKEQKGLWWPSQLIIHGEHGDVRLTLDPSGTFAEYNFTTPPSLNQVDALTDGEYQLYLAFTIEPFGVVDQVPAARFSVQEGSIVAFTPLPQIARLSYGTEYVEPLILEK